MEDIRGSVVAAFLNIALRVYPDPIRHTLITKKCVGKDTLMTRVRLQWLLLAIALPICIGLAAIPAFGQATNTGTVVGVVTDQSGAVVPGANITLTDITTNIARSLTTNGAGEYVFVNVPPSNYNILVTKAGFSADKIEGQTVSVGSQTTANFKLRVGAAQQTIEVQTTNVELQTLNATIGATVAPVAIDSLPALGRDVATFATLQPGVSPEGSVAGTVVDQTVFQLDGGSNTNDMDGSMNVYTPSFAGNPTGIGGIGAGASGVMPTPADSVEEFKVNTANQTADFDNSSGSQIEVVTKRGGQKWHGTVYEYYLDNTIDANSWDNNLSGTPTPDYHYNRFGAAGGGPLINKNILGGKTFFFANYEGFRYPNSQTFEQAVPSAAMQAGFLTFSGVTYNLNTLDPRGIGINPTVAAMWAKYEPVGNDPSCGTIKGTRCDGVNEIGYKSNISVPQKSNFGVARIDHDFGSRWHFMSSYRYYNLTLANTSQVDIGGFFAGDTKGVPASLSQRPQVPWYYVAQLTTTISSGVTNDFHYSFLRNYWSWSDKNAPPQITGLGGVLEPLGESSTVLSPYNVNSQSIRTRFWDGHDNFIRDDITMLKGNHLFNFGGQYQRNWDYHQRSDNGGGINFTTTYQLGDSAGSGQVALSGLQNAGYPTNTTASRDAAAVLGIVTDSQVAYTRTGNNLSLNPPLTPASDKSTIPYYNVYFGDAWHMKPNLTLTYGLGWTLEMPPTEATGKQVELVDDADQQLDGIGYLA
ncbi:MAG TPA: carboxypeptidase-like regulatory domain-containing protein, partial [Bryobacteraceae bacterium]